MKQIKCRSCDGHYKIRGGKFGDFAGCSNYPQCKSTLKIHDFVFEYIKAYGINVYAWEKACWKCGKNTKVYSYYLNYDLAEADDYFEHLGNIGLGDIGSVDKYLSDKYSTINVRFSKTVNGSYMANTCEYCRALQGRNYVVEDPHEIMNDLMFDHDMDKYWVENIPCEKAGVTWNEIKSLFLME
jgi:ssDNA-binding Zn-finger/Zn-ribbon topoisomerase 1